MNITSLQQLKHFLKVYPARYHRYLREQYLKSTRFTVGKR